MSNIFTYLEEVQHDSITDKKEETATEVHE